MRGEYQTLCEQCRYDHVQGFILDRVAELGNTPTEWDALMDTVDKLDKQDCVGALPWVKGLPCALCSEAMTSPVLYLGGLHMTSGSNLVDSR